MPTDEPDSSDLEQAQRYKVILEYDAGVMVRTDGKHLTSYVNVRGEPTPPKSNGGDTRSLNDRIFNGKQQKP